MREPQLNLVVGAPGYGKSTWVEERVRKSTLPNALIYVEEEDILNGAYQSFPLRSFYNYAGGKVRINAEKTPYDEFIDQVIKNFSNGVLVIDEGGIYEKGRLSQPMSRLMKVRRKKGIDIFINYHGMSGLPVAQFEVCNNIILFHSADEFAAKSNVPKRRELMAARERIEAQVKRGNKYYCEPIWLS